MIPVHTVRARTFRSTASPHNQQQQQPSHPQSTLSTGDSLAKAVRLPEGEDRQEWIALAVTDLYNHTNMLYAAATAFCSPRSCPRMTAGPAYEYLWPQPAGPPLALAAPAYVEALLKWTQSFLDDPHVFPARMGKPFPPHFDALVKTIFRRLLRVHAHLHAHHSTHLAALGLLPHLNTVLKHFVLFANEFQLLNRTDYGPLIPLVDEILGV